FALPEFPERMRHEKVATQMPTWRVNSQARMAWDSQDDCGIFDTFCGRIGIHGELSSTLAVLGRRRARSGIVPTGRSSRSIGLEIPERPTPIIADAPPGASVCARRADA